MNTIDLSDQTSFVALVVGKGMEIPKDVALHPQVVLLDGMAKYETGALPPLPPPPQLKGIFYSDALALDRTQALQNEAKRRGIPYIARGTGNALQELIRPALATAPKRLPASNGSAPAQGGRPKGTIMDFVKANQDSTKGTAEEGRRLFELAKRQGITTTIGSITQAVSHHRRQGRLTGRPESLMDPKERLRVGALRTLDEAIAGLQLTREFVEQVELEITELREFKANIEALMGKGKS